MSLAVRGDRVLVEVEDQSVTALPSGLIMVERDSPPVVGEVVYTGDQTRDVQVGDVVVFSREAGLPMTYEGRGYLMLHEPEILAVVEGV